MRLSLPKKYRPLVWLIFITTIIRLMVAFFIELGNDEVYYFTYATFPDWSHFDHPPLIGWLIKVFSFGLYPFAGWLMRLPAIILAAANTWLMFEVGARVKNEKTGWYAALLYSTSIYTSVIAGTFIMPDSPQVFFWILALYLMLDILPDKDTVNSNKRRFLLLGMVIGLGMLSKYTSVFLWPGIFLYLIFYNRNWFKSLSLYAAGLISLIVFSPVLIWNYLHHFISFTFHGDRVEMAGSSIRFDLIGTEILGEFIYQNPVVFILVWTAFIYGIRHHYNFVEKRKFHLLLFQSVPMIAVFLFFSLFRRTLPHWTGPAYIALIFIGAAFLSRKNAKNDISFPPVIKAAALVFVLILGLGFAQIRFGIVDLKSMVGNDVSLDMYGWRIMKKAFGPIKDQAEQEGQIQKDAPIISHRWFPAANLDYYVAIPNGTYVLGWGSLERIHKYAWINQERGGYKMGMDVWFITFDIDYVDPKFAMEYFEQIKPYDTIEISRSGKIVKEAYLYIFEDLKKLPPDDFTDFMEKHSK